MHAVDEKMICELSLLKNRLDAGESFIQCLGTMGIPLAGHQEFLRRWQKLSGLILEGRVLPARAVGEFVTTLDESNRLLSLVAQKTLSPRLQAYLSLGLILVLLLAAVLVFPPSLRPGAFTLTLSLGLCGLSALCMQLLLRKFTAHLCFLDWLAFLKSLSLSLQCGLTLPAALVENLPPPEVRRAWPPALRAQLNLAFLEGAPLSSPAPEPPATGPLSPLWKLAERVWAGLSKNYRDGLPQVELIAKMARLQEEEFKSWMNRASEKLGYLLLLPLFMLSVPAVLILLFAPLLRALL